MPVPTPWIRSYDIPELYIGGYKSGVAAGEVNQRGQIAGMEAANRLQIAQMEVAARQDIANKQLLAEEHRAAIADQYRQAEFGLKRQELEQQQKYQQAKIDEAARQAKAQMEIQARVKAGEPYDKVVKELGIAGGLGYFRDPVQRPAPLDPYTKSTLGIYEQYSAQLLKDRAVALAAGNKEAVENIDTELWRSENKRRNALKIESAPGNPLPNDERLLVLGRVYQTSQGPAVWNGKKLVTLD